MLLLLGSFLVLMLVGLPEALRDLKDYRLLAFAVLLAAPASPAGIVAAAHELADASGAYGMAGGQAIDLANVGKPMSQTALEEMHALKTGAMFEAAVILPALLAEEDEATIAALSAYAQKIGLVFQVVDDVLDATAERPLRVVAIAALPTVVTFGVAEALGMTPPGSLPPTHGFSARGAG